MAVLSECYLQRIENISVTEALTLNSAPKPFKRFADDSHARFNTREQSSQFLNMLNSQDPSIRYTIEFENEKKQLSFLDATITNTGNNSHDFKIFRKTSIAIVQVRSNSNIAPNTAVEVFKGFHSRTYKICTDFLINIFTENGHDRNTLTNIATEYLRNINKQQQQKKTKNNQNNPKNTKHIRNLPWVPIIGPKLQKEFKKKYIKTVFTLGANLILILQIGANFVPIAARDICSKTFSENSK